MRCEGNKNNAPIIGLVFYEGKVDLKKSLLMTEERGGEMIGVSLVNADECEETSSLMVHTDSKRPFRPS
jgi:hypothetical protein